MAGIGERLEGIRRRMSAASLRAGRDPQSTRLVAVSKTVQASRILEAVRAGQRLFGENRVQEARSKQEAVGPSAVWHLVGHLQRNKAKEASRLFQMIHSVDSLELLQDLQRHAAGREEPLEALIQVNLASEPGKHGIGGQELPEILAAAAGMRHIKVKGLMILPPYDPDPERSRPLFRRMAELADEMERRNFDNVSLRELSMGMSEDFEVAIEEGATLIRIGRALFRERPPVV
ncbi:MAG: YggS family pyridoxal phosphate-dependent enzyme [Acidobacteria bacterium]|nr:YggS family pyridoxal phosphate-dependent enzyme [Acidobacteriota bacterium]